MSTCKSVGSRVGLYVMVFFILVHSCDTNTKLDNMEYKLDKIQSKLDEVLIP